MAIVCQNDFGWIVDHRLMLDHIYKECDTINHDRATKNIETELPYFAGINKSKYFHKSNVFVGSLPSKLENEGSLETLNLISNVPCPDDIPVTDDLSVAKCNVQCALPKETSMNSSPNAMGYRCLPSMFEINSPFMMDSQFMKVKLTETGEAPQHEKNLMKREKRKRKRKADCPLNDGEKKAMEYHQQVKDKLLKAYNTLRTILDDKSYFSGKTTLKEDDGDCSTESLPLTNNRAARDIAALDGTDQWMVDIYERKKLPPGIKEDNTCMLFSGMSSDHMSNCIVNYSGKSSTEVILNRESYLIPPRCSFLLSDISHFVQRSDITDFNLVVMDPPWQNKSVKRQKQYCTLSQSDLYKLPVQRLAAWDCLVVVWVTNRQAHRSWVREELFPHWGVTYRTTWHWLKVTTTGDMVYDFDSDHKKPYESLIIGQYAPQSELSPLPADRTIISVPCCLHSKKPPLTEILSPYLPVQPRCIELFARNLLADWMSWGNEFFHLHPLQVNLVHHTDLARRLLLGNTYHNISSSQLLYIPFTPYLKHFVTITQLGPQPNCLLWLKTEAKTLPSQLS